MHFVVIWSLPNTHMLDHHFSNLMVQQNVNIVIRHVNATRSYLHFR